MPKLKTRTHSKRAHIVFLATASFMMAISALLTVLGIPQTRIIPQYNVTPSQKMHHSSTPATRLPHNTPYKLPATLSIQSTPEQSRSSTFTELSKVMKHFIPSNPFPKLSPKLKPSPPQKKKWPDTALVTLADPKFQHCSLQLVAKARNLHWKGKIILLAINYNRFSRTTMKQLEAHGVTIIHTNGIFEVWLSKKIPNRWQNRALNAFKFRKMEIFLNSALRAYRRVIYLDPDGYLNLGMEPMLNVEFPKNTVVMMRQNDRSFKKGSFWENEIEPRFLNQFQRSVLTSKYPDREMTGASCWLIVDMTKLQSPTKIFTRSLHLLCSLRAAFKMNDQTLISLLFYDQLAFIPWCSLRDIALQTSTNGMSEYCLQLLARQLKENRKVAYMYRHMSRKEKSKCMNAKHKTSGSAAGGDSQPRVTWDKGIKHIAGAKVQGFSIHGRKFSRMSCARAQQEWSKKGRVV